MSLQGSHGCSCCCSGWINGLRNGTDPQSLLHALRHAAESVWSRINVDNVARLIKEKKMTRARARAFPEAAKADRHYNSASQSGKDMKIPTNLRRHRRRAQRQGHARDLSEQNRFALAFHLQQHEDRSRAEDRDLRRDARAWRNNLPTTQEMSVWSGWEHGDNHHVSGRRQNLVMKQSYKCCSIFGTLSPTIDLAVCRVRFGDPGAARSRSTFLSMAEGGLGTNHQEAAGLWHNAPVDP